jgi:predicted esterase
MRAEENLKTPLFLAHGTEDEVVNPKFAELSYKVFKDLGMDVTFKKYQGMGHNSSDEELFAVRQWIKARIPDVPVTTEESSKTEAPKQE